MDKLYYPAVMYPEEDGGYSVWLNDINGCVSQGETLAEAVENIKDALGLYYEDAAEDRIVPPHRWRRFCSYVKCNSFVQPTDDDACKWARQDCCQTAKADPDKPMGKNEGYRQ